MSVLVICSLHSLNCTLTAPEKLTAELVDFTTLTTFSLSWTAPNVTVNSYEVMWERDTTGECPDADEGSSIITNGYTSYTITGVQEDSTYTITVTATNAAGSAVSVPVTGMTGKAGEGLVIWYEEKHTQIIYPLLQLHLPLPLLLVHLM